MKQLWAQPLHPTNLTVGFCIPTTDKEYLEHAKKADVHDFIQSTLGCHDERALLSKRKIKAYVEAIGEPCARAISIFKHTGARVTQEMTLHKFSAELARPDCHFLMLFAHSPQKPPRIEFFDGFVTYDQFIEAVPPDYGGGLDLVICHSDIIADRMRQTRPETGPVKYEKASRNLPHAVTLQSAVVKLLSEDTLTYYGALAACLKYYKEV